MRTKSILVLLLTILPGLSGCVVNRIVRVASDDLDCPEHRIQVSRGSIFSTRFVVVGCGYRATYDGRGNVRTVRGGSPSNIRLGNEATVPPRRTYPTRSSLMSPSSAPVDVSLLLDACSQGRATSCEALASARQMEGDIPGACWGWEQGCRAGSTRACSEAASLCHSTTPSATPMGANDSFASVASEDASVCRGLSADDCYSMALAALAQDDGSDRGCEMLGENCSRRHPESCSILESSCPEELRALRGGSVGAGSTGSAESGVGVPQDGLELAAEATHGDSDERNRLREYCFEGSPAACMDMAEDLLAVGQTQEACTYFGLACGFGDSTGCERAVACAE